MKTRLNVVDYIITAVLLLIGFICLVPILNAIAISFSDKTSAAMGQVIFVPKNFNTAAYHEIVTGGRFIPAFFVSLQRVLLGVTINTGFSILMAYPLSKSQHVFRLRNVYMWVMVFTMLFSGGLIPTFLLVKNLRLINTIWSLVLPGAISVFNVIILMNFNKGIPASLEESALIDGANPWQIMVRIYVPLAKASIATIALFSMVYHWNEFFMGKIYINTVDKQPLQTYIQGLTVQLNTQQMANMTPEEILRKLTVSNITFNSAKAIVSMIPVVIVYPFLQRFFVTGLVMGAVKE